MASDHQVFIVRDRGGGMYRPPARVVDMEFGDKVVYDGQPAGVVDMAAGDNSMNDVIRMKEKDQVYTPAHLGITGKRAVQMSMKEFAEDMEVEDNCLGMKATDLDEPVVDLASTRGMKPGEDMQWRGRKKVEDVQSPDVDNTMFLYNDAIIDMKVAKKKVIPAEARDESNKLVEMPEVKHKVPLRLKIAQKRPLLSFEDKGKSTPTSPCVWMETETESRSLKAATSLIKDIENKTAKPQCISFNPEMFSGFDQLHNGVIVGQGSFGKVIKVNDVKKGHSMIVKKVKMIEKNEIIVPLQFPYQDSLARIFGFGWDGEDAQLVQEDAGISLRQLITVKEKSPLEENGQIEKILLDIFQGISLLARHGITHCDIKPENVCFNLDTLRAKLIDLGSSRTSQDAVTYKGITPEYLPPAPNKFCYLHLVCGERNLKVHRLDEKDDVWAGAMVGLFLMMRAHPMIKWVTTLPDYPGQATDQEKERLRSKVMEQISQLCDERSLSPDNPKAFPVKDVLKQLLTTRSYTKKLPIMEELLQKVLVVDEDRRLTSAEVVRFLQKRLDMVTQPPTKAVKRCDSAQVEDLEIDDVDLKIAKNGQQQLQQPQSPHQVQDQCSALGVAFKPAATQMTAGVLAPAKFNFQPPQQIAPTPAATRTTLMTSRPAAAAAAPTLVVRQTQNRRASLWKNGSEAAEYESLVESFNLSAKVTPGPIQQVTRRVPPPTQSPATGFYAQPAGYAVQRSPTSGYQDMDISKRHAYNRVQPSCMQGDDPSANAVTIKGLFEGNSVVFCNGREVGMVEQQSEGNLPNMEALMSASFGEGGDLNRPKLKGRRRNGPNY